MHTYCGHIGDHARVINTSVHPGWVGRLRLSRVDSRMTACTQCTLNCLLDLSRLSLSESLALQQLHLHCTGRLTVLPTSEPALMFACGSSLSNQGKSGARPPGARQVVNPCGAAVADGNHLHRVGTTCCAGAQASHDLQHPHAFTSTLISYHKASLVIMGLAIMWRQAQARVG